MPKLVTAEGGDPECRRTVLAIDPNSLSITGMSRGSSSPITSQGGVLDLGIWGKDELNRDVLIYNGPYADGQEILIDGKYQAVHVATGFMPDNPPKVRRWFFQGGWWRQAFFDSHVQVEVYYYS